MNIIYKLLLAFNSSSWIIIIYFVKENYILTSLFFIIISMLAYCISILLVFKLSSEYIPKEISEFSIADGDFLPTYLGYFFVGLSINNNFMLIIMYLIIFTFIFLSQNEYFNPIFLLFGFHFYRITTKAGSNIFIIKKGKIVKNIENLEFSNLGRINDTTFIERGNL